MVVLALADSSKNFFSKPPRNISMGERSKNVFQIVIFFNINTNVLYLSKNIMSK